MVYTNRAMYSHLEHYSSKHHKQHTDISIHVQKQGMQSHIDLTPVKLLD